MKKILSTALITLLVTACSGGKTKLPGNLYPAEYTEVEGMPYNIQLNTNATWERTDSFENFRTMSISYPLYEAEGVLSVLMVDSAKLLHTMSRHLEFMELHADTIGDIIENRNPAGVQSWIFVFPRGKEQIQWMATDSATMYVAGRIHLATARDSALDITPALDNITADIKHLLHNLTPK